ncbi:DsbA family protein [Paenibacillus xerothermodurans]|uniref:DsbA family protein n=2 Tax=Paenibacillus xerothermodurans TaxID=1977292 RepID=A0A2W1NAB3_PAEXE|nr:DsbA family protein [Paenibacillus xerothermodurans]
MWSTVAFVAAVIAALIIFSPKAAPTEMPYDKLPVLGNKNAPVKIVELGDYKCPTCQYFSQQVAPQLKKEYIDTGIASLHFMNLTILGPDSNTAALAGQAVYHQNNDAFWKYYDAVYKNQGDERTQWATPEFLTDLARREALPIDYDLLKQDILSKKYQSEVDEQNAFARQNQVTTTPTVFVNGKKLDGFDYNSLKAAIEEARKGE